MALSRAYALAPHDIAAPLSMTHLSRQPFLRPQPNSGRNRMLFGRGERAIAALPRDMRSRLFNP